MQNLKQQIKSHLQTILSWKLENIYASSPNKQQWNNFSDAELRKYIEGLFLILKKIYRNDSHLDNIGFNNLSALASNYLPNLMNSYQNNNLGGIDSYQMSTQYFDFMNWIDNTVTFLRSSGIYTQIEISNELIKKVNDEFLEAQPLLEEVIKRKPVIEKALGDLQGILNQQGEINTAIVHGQADAFRRRADEYKASHTDFTNLFSGFWKIWKWRLWHLDLRGTWWWLLGALLFASITGTITFVVIMKQANLDTSTGQAILRITSIIVPSYLTVFCASQYLYGKRIYESYMFKYASLQTMNNLITTNAELKENILSRGLDVLFSEPSAKNATSTKEDKQIMTELLSMLRGQLKD